MANKSGENTVKCRPKELYRLDGKVAVVSGGAGIIGAKLCEILAQAGADVVMVDIDAELAQTESKRIAAQGRSAPANLASIA